MRQLVTGKVTGGAKRISRECPIRYAEGGGFEAVCSQNPCAGSDLGSSRDKVSLSLEPPNVRKLLTGYTRADLSGRRCFLVQLNQAF